MQELKQRIIDARDNGFTLTSEDYDELIKLTDIVHCPECKYYYAPVCTYYNFLPMTSRRGYCYHGIKGEYTGETPPKIREHAFDMSKYMNPPEEDNEHSKS